MSAVTVHVISVGLSVLRSLEDEDKLTELGQKRDLITAIRQAKPQDLLKEAAADKTGDAASDWLASVLARPDDPLRDQQAAERLAAATAAIKPDQWHRRISAELGTFAAVQGGAIQLRKSDTAVLVCTDTAEDLLAGLWNATALTGGVLSRIRYLAAPAAQLGKVRGAVLLTRIKQLDASSDSGFATAMRGLGTLGRGLLDAEDIGQKDPFSFYLSGGYKAAIPYLIGLAEGVRSAGGDRAVDAYVLHESSEKDKAIRLPLRRVIPESVSGELSDFNDHTGICDTKIPEPRVLEGYAYEREGKKRFKLTPFGEGLRALFPRLHEQSKPWG